MAKILSAKKEAFCQLFLSNGRNATQAYRDAYQISHLTKQRSVETSASYLINSPEIQVRIDELIDASTAASPVTIELGQCLAAWVQIAMADPDELIGLRIGCCRYCWGEGGRYQWKEGEFLDACDAAERAAVVDPNAPEAQLPDIAGGFGYRFSDPPNPDCERCEGEGRERIVARDTSNLSPGARALYGGVKQTRNGIEIIIADRTKALENVTRMLGGFQDKVRLDGSLVAMQQVMREMPNDPMLAGRIYQDMIRGLLPAANAA